MTDSTPTPSSPRPSSPWPLEIRLKRAERVLEVAFEDGARFQYPAELLRVESPSAEVQGHSPSQRKIVPNKRNVRFIGAEPVGNYAIRLLFDDGHDSGYYSWAYLYELGQHMAERWESYIDALNARGLAR